MPSTFNQTDGRCDLLDFTPAWIDMRNVFPAQAPGCVTNAVRWELFSHGVNAVWAGLSRHEAGRYLKEYLWDRESAVSRSGESRSYPSADGWYTLPLQGAPEGRARVLNPMYRFTVTKRWSFWSFGYEYEGERAMRTLAAFIAAALAATAFARGTPEISFETKASTGRATERLRSEGIEAFMGDVWINGVPAPRIHSLFFVEYLPPDNLSPTSARTSPTSTGAWSRSCRRGRRRSFVRTSSSRSRSAPST